MKRTSCYLAMHVRCQFSDWKAILICLLLTPCFSLPAQAPKKSPHRWGEIPTEQLSLHQYPNDPEAEALVLLDYGAWDFKNTSRWYGFLAELTIHYRVKILQESAIDRLAEQEIVYISEQGFEKLRNFSAQTINPQGDGTALISAVDRGGTYKEEIEDGVTRFSFAFPNVKVGSILEYTYQLTSGDISSLKPWSFQGIDPSLRSEMTLGDVRGLEYNCILHNVPDSMAIGKDKHWVMTNVPRMKAERFVRNHDKYRSHLTFELKDYKKVRYSTDQNYAGQKTTTVTTSTMNLYDTWEELAKDLYNDNFPVLISSSSDTLETLLPGILEGAASQEDTVAQIFNFVRDSLTWNGRRGRIARPKLPRNILRVDTVNAASLNVLLTHMLQRAGIPCQAAVISTVDHGNFVFNYPVLSQFNHLITVAVVNGKNHFLDATNPMRPWNLPALGDLNGYAYLLDFGQNHGWIELPNQYPSSSRASGMFSINEEGELVGWVTESYDGYRAMELRTALKEIEDEEEFWEDWTEEEWIDTEMDSTQIMDKLDPEKSLKLKYHLRSSDYVSEVGDYLYINPIVTFDLENNPFTEPDRQFPIEFGYCHKRTYSLSLFIPEGYEIESLPKGARVSFPENAYQYVFQAQQMGSVIQLMLQFNRNQADFPVEAYESLRQLYDHVIGKQGEQIVLKKI